jgi:hypothetical protein
MLTMRSFSLTLHIKRLARGVALLSVIPTSPYAAWYQCFNGYQVNCVSTLVCYGLLFIGMCACCEVL